MRRPLTPGLVSRLSVIKAVSAVFSLINSQCSLSVSNKHGTYCNLALSLSSQSSQTLHLTNTLHWRDKPCLSLYPGETQPVFARRSSREEGTSSAQLCSAPSCCLRSSAGVSSSTLLSAACSRRLQLAGVVHSVSPDVTARPEKAAAATERLTD